MPKSTKHWEIPAIPGAVCIIALAPLAAPAQSYHSWAIAHGVSHQLAADDFNGDGITNFLNYALGHDPRLNDKLPFPDGAGMLTFPKGTEAVASGGMSWEIQVSSNLEPDSWQAVEPVHEDDSSISHFIAVGNGPVFVRLAVSRQLHPAATAYSESTGLSGEALDEVSRLLYDLADAGIEPDLLVLAGDRYLARDGATVRAIVGGLGTVSGTIGSNDRAMVFDGSASWIEFDNPARSDALADYAIFAVASADSSASQSMVASSFGGATQRGTRLMFNGSSSWGAMPGRVAADANRGNASDPSGWNTTTRVHAGGHLLPLAVNFSALTAIPRGDLAPPVPGPRLTVSAGITRSSAATAPLGDALWNDSAKFRIGANLTGGAFHQGEVAMVMVCRTPTYAEAVHQLMATAPVRIGIIPRYGLEAVAVFDGDSVTEGAGSPGAAYGTWSWPAQLFGNQANQVPGGQWTGKFSGRNIAVGGRAIASNEAAWEHTTRHILARPEWGLRYHFTMISHNQRVPPMGDPTSLQRLGKLWDLARQTGVIPVCVGLVSGQNLDPDRIVEHESGYAAVRSLALTKGVLFVDTGAIPQLQRGEFPSGADYFYLDQIHPTEKGYRLIAQEVAAALPFPGSAAPRSLARPVVTGEADVGMTLTCSAGGWENAPAQVRHQWMRNASEIPGATSADYTPTEADLGSKLSCRVTAENAHGAAERTSAHTPAVGSPASSDS